MTDHNGLIRLIVEHFNAVQVYSSNDKINKSVIFYFILLVIMCLSNQLNYEKLYSILAFQLKFNLIKIKQYNEIYIYMEQSKVVLHIFPYFWSSLILYIYIYIINISTEKTNISPRKIMARTSKFACISTILIIILLMNLGRWFYTLNICCSNYQNISYLKR